MKRFISLLLTLSLLACGMVFFSGCGAEDTKPVSVVISVKDYGDITVELYPKYAPITVKNFLKLVDEEFYDGLTFHRVIKDFMIQGGDPMGNGSGSSATKIKGEFTSNGVDNPLKHSRGAISMARGNDPDSASCQFFICHQVCATLDGSYAVFGMVTSGMDVVDAIAEVEVEYNDNPYYPEQSVPVENIIIESIRRVEASK